MSDSILSAIIATVTTLAVTVIKDVIIEGSRKRREARLSLIDRKLKDLYSPMFIALGAGNYGLGSLMKNEYAYTCFIQNYHLLSLELRTILEEIMKLTSGDSPREMKVRLSDGERCIELQEQLAIVLKRDIDELREEFARVSGERPSAILKFLKEQFQQ